MSSNPFDIDETWLAVVVETGGRHFAIPSRDVLRLDAWSEGETREALSLGQALELNSEAPEPQVVWLVEGKVGIRVEAVLGVEDLRGATFLELPRHTRLKAPVIRGVYHQPDDSLLPQLDTAALVSGGTR